MIFDARSGGSPDRIEADICIFGAGAVGIAIARELASSGLRVALVESGGEDPENEAQELCAMEIKGLRPMAPPEASRLRYLGGTTNHWGGWNRPFSRRAVAKWPIPYEELSSRFSRTNELLELVDRDFDDLASFPQFDDQFFANYGPGLITGVRQIRELRFWPVYGKGLSTRENITVVTNANLVDFVFTEDRESILSAVAKTLTGRSLSIAARFFVLACGGLENPVVLQNIDETHEGLFSRKTGAIGRYYSDHVEIMGGCYPLRCFIPALYQRFWEIDNEKQYLWTRMFAALDPAVHRELGAHPHAFAFAPFHAQCQYRTEWDFENLYDRIAQHDANFTVPAPKDENPELKLEGVLLQFATTPNPESRIVLSDKTNALGVKAGVLDWRIFSDDIELIHRIALAGEKTMAANGIARLRLAAPIAEKGLNTTEDEVYNSSHHMGGTRMGIDPRQSVVDPDCRFHGMRNLFIAGPGVFPSFDWPGPTYTAITLALRLADRLRELT